MSPLWKPAMDPPKLDRYCHLSNDAQIVMSAIYRQYQQQKSIQQSQRCHGFFQCFPKHDQQNFELNTSTSSGQNIADASQNEGHRRQEDRQEFGDFNADCTISVIPESPNLPLQIIGANNRVMTPRNDEILFEIAARNRKFLKPVNADITDDFNSHYQDRENSMTVKFRNNDSMFTEQDLSRTQPDRHYGHHQNIAYELNAQSRTDGCIRKDEVLNNTPNTDRGDEMNIECENDFCSFISLSETPVKKGSIAKKCSINRKLEEHAIIRKEKAAQKEVEQTSQMVIAGNMSSSGKFDEIGSSNVNCNTLKKKMHSFFAPIKKQKVSDLTEQVPRKETSMDCSMGDNSFIKVDTLGENDLLLLEKQILQSDEVLLALTFRDKSTQLRENMPMNNKKKAASSYKNRSSASEVEYIAVCISSNSDTKGDNSNKNDVWTFPISISSDEFKNWNRKFWKELMTSSIRKICCDAKQFLLVLIQHLGIEDVKDFAVLDPVIAAWLLDPDAEAQTFQSALTAVCLQQKENLYNNGIEGLSADMPIISELMKRLYKKLQSRDLWDIFYCLEMKLVPILTIMELRPLKIDVDILIRYSDALKKKMQKLEQSAYQAAGHKFLINSPAQLRQVLFEELQLDRKCAGKVKLAKTAMGHQTSTSEAVLSHLVDVHPLPAIILEYRQIQKLKSTYVDGMLSCVKNNYLFTHWDQTSAATGRLSSYQPNIQAIPKTPVTITGYSDNFIIGKEKEEKMEIFARDPFVSHEESSFLAADFQQIELRLLAHLADDPILLDIFCRTENEDIFLQLTSQWLSKPLSNVTSNEREQTKRVVYSVMYGAGKEKLAEYLKISRDDAKAIMDSFLAKFPAVNQFSKKCVEFCQRNGFTSTIFKRRRLFPNIKSMSPPLRAQAERQAVNFCVQGSAADLCKAAMIQVEHTLSKHKQLRAKVLVQIHDELLLEVADEDLNAVKSLVKAVMEDEESLCGKMVKLRVPIRVSLSVGKTWGHLSAA